jgi:1-acyl-sn-glycerol-3-phosphate acyltransferase
MAALSRDLRGRGVLAPLTGVAALVLMLVCLLAGFALILPGALVKLALPIAVVRRGCTRYLVWVVGDFWMGGNRRIWDWLHGRRTGFHLPPDLDCDHSWLLICNHQSWADIVILLDAIGGRVPLPRFFLKRELLWVPVIGLAGWALDMPFMRRDRGGAQVDLVATRRACARYREQPVTLVNFVEGTRCSPDKQARRGSPYRHLLRPKAGGLAFAVGAMGDQFAGLLDVTIVYRPSARRKVWSFLCGEQREVQVVVRRRELPDWLLHGDYAGDREFRQRFQAWLNALWAEKDRQLAEATR